MLQGSSRTRRYSRVYCYCMICLPSFSRNSFRQPKQNIWSEHFSSLRGIQSSITFLLLLHEPAFDANSAVCEVLTHVVLDLLCPDSQRTLLNEFLNSLKHVCHHNIIQDVPKVSHISSLLRNRLLILGSASPLLQLQVRRI